MDLVELKILGPVAAGAVLGVKGAGLVGQSGVVGIIAAIVGAAIGLKVGMALTGSHLKAKS